MQRRILYIFRRTSRFFSIENIFNLISEELSQKQDLVPSRTVVPKEGFSIGVVAENGMFVRKQGADLYHITGDVHYISLFLPGRRTILTIHDIGFLFQSAGIKRWILKKLLLDWPVARCRQITTISENTKKDILAFTRCKADKITVIPNPVSRRINFEPRPFRTAKPVLLFIGITPNKNLARTISALKGIPCILEIIGEIPAPHLRQLEEDGIEYRNYVNLTDDEMAGRYVEADIVLFPSTYEGFGMPIIEGQKTGRPVITSNLSPMKEVAGGAACLVDPTAVASIREGLIKVIEDNVYRDMLVKKGRENVRSYELDHIAAKYYALYHETLKEV